MANGQQIPGQQFISDPLASMAMQYGQTLAEQGKDVVNKNVSLAFFFSKLYTSVFQHLNNVFAKYRALFLEGGAGSSLCSFVI